MTIEDKYGFKKKYFYKNVLVVSGTGKLAVIGIKQTKTPESSPHGTAILDADYPSISIVVREASQHFNLACFLKVG